MNLQRRPTGTGLLHKAYSVCITAALPLVSLGLVASVRGRRRLSERFGLWQPVGDVDWWLHGASVGEVVGLSPLIADIREQERQGRLLLTATSPTGLTRGEQLVDVTRLIPIDAPFLIHQAMQRVSARRLVITETELWPNLITSVADSGVPVHLINGRISDYTLGRYRAFRSLFAPLLRRFSSVSVADAEQRDRFIELGIDPSLISVTGHTKYDVAPRYDVERERDASRSEFFPGIKGGERVVVLGSIHRGEERFWLPALKRAFDDGHRLNVIVAPRHAERFDYFFKVCKSHGFNVARWSERDQATVRGANLVLLDTMGELERAYLAADLAFVGATLVDIGGHNPLEPAMYGVPVVVGPNISVIREPIGLLRARGGVLDVRSEEDIYRLLAKLCSEDVSLCGVGQAALDVQRSMRGASKRVLEAIFASEGQ